ncbi:MAG TPA: hypothetical protein VKX28_06435 [Xanthobacteraceae bacterium]|nr:hypothetical protein [Xanthobacteraceae bacterium]
MKIVLEPADDLADGVWRAVAPPHQIAKLGRGVSSQGQRSVILASSSEFKAETRQLFLDAATVAVLNVGTTPSVIVIDTAVGAEALAEQVAEAAGYAPGDSEFQKLVELELHGEAQEAARDFLRELRKRWPGDLKRGERNNFSNTPDNFCYIIVQPRAQALSITIRGVPERFLSTIFNLGPDRPGHTRFSLRRPEEVAEAIRLIAISKNPEDANPFFKKKRGFGSGGAEP